MRLRRIALSVIAALALVVAGCGDDDDAGSDDTSTETDAGGSDDGGSDAGAVDGGSDDGGSDGGGSADTAVVVTVDGTTYPITTVQTCQTERDEDRETDVTMFGFAESGERVELSIRYQGADTSPTGTDQYYASVSIASDELRAQTTEDDPFGFLDGDRSTVTGEITMLTTTGSEREIQVAFDITCP